MALVKRGLDLTQPAQVSKQLRAERIALARQRPRKPGRFPHFTRAWIVDEHGNRRLLPMGTTTPNGGKP
jgi:hypothetical protein